MGRHYMRRLSPVDLVGAVCARVREGTGTDCLTDPNGRESPFYAAQLVSTRPGKSKMMRLDVFSVLVYCISAPSETQGPVLGMVAALEEAMERDVELPCPFSLVRQEDTGVQVVKRDPTGEWNAAVGFDLTVSYGLIIK